MNKKPIYTDFLNAQWKPVPMVYGFKPNVRPYILPRNRGILPMPKAGHIQFGELAALDKAEFNPLPHRPEIQLPGKIYEQMPIPQQKFLNAANVKLINSGKIKRIFTGVKLVSSLESPIVAAMKGNNLKLITLEMIKNSVTGLKIDPKLGTSQQQLQARSAYDNLIVQYTSLVDQRKDNPENTRRIIDQYEKEMVAIYGSDIKKNVSDQVIDKLTKSINDLTKAYGDLYTMINNKSIDKPEALVEPLDLEGAKPGEQAELEEKEDPNAPEAPEEEVKEPFIDEEAKRRLQEREEAVLKRIRELEEEEEDRAREKAKEEGKLSVYEVMDSVMDTFMYDDSKNYFVGGYINDDPRIFNRILERLENKWSDINNISADILVNMSYQIIQLYNVNIKDPLEQDVEQPKPDDLNDPDIRKKFMSEISTLFRSVVAKEEPEGTVVAPTVSSDSIVQQWYAKYANPSDPKEIPFKVKGIFDDLYKSFEQRPMSKDEIRTIVVECLDRLDSTQLKRLYKANSTDKKKYDLRRADDKDEFERSLKEYVIDPAVTLNDISHTYALIQAKQEVKAQGAVGRKRKSNKRPVKKSVKKISPQIHTQILRILKS